MFTSDWDFRDTKNSRMNTHKKTIVNIVSWLSITFISWNGNRLIKSSKIKFMTKTYCFENDSTSTSYCHLQFKNGSINFELLFNLCKANWGQNYRQQKSNLTQLFLWFFCMSLRHLSHKSKQNYTFSTYQEELDDRLKLKKLYVIKLTKRNYNSYHFWIILWGFSNIRLISKFSRTTFRCG